MPALAQDLALFGANPKHVVAFTGELEPATLAFADIVAATHDRPDAVVVDESGAALAYVVDSRNTATTEVEITRLRRLLAFRGDAAFLVVVRPGQLDIHDVGLLGPRTESPRWSVEESADEARFLFPRLEFAPEAVEPGHQAIHKTLFALMKEAIDALQAARGQKLEHLISRQDALSLVGRAVFVRFLFDRGLLTGLDASTIVPGLDDPRQLFDTSESASLASNWLDRVFNGDFLPTSFEMTADALERRISPEGWKALGNISRNAPGGQLPLEAALPDPSTWSGLDFSRIPVGVLSQVYEQQTHDWEPQRGKKQSVYYTPGPIATFMVSEAFASLEDPTTDPADVRVLDPAVGGGIFLVSAFRELVARQWRKSGVRPDTAQLRRIIYKQLAGFDLERIALRLSALSLYLAAIELDPVPLPLSNLRFDQPLLGTCLHFVGGDGPEGAAGSLGPNVGDEHDKSFDIVIGNPPWTSNKSDAATKKVVLATLRPIISDVLGDSAGTAYSLPDGNPDVAFIWRARQWCKPGGRIALVAHARLLFKQSSRGRETRAALFAAISWTSIVNGAAVRFTDVWPNVDHPFVLLFGVNESPEATAGFYFYSPYLESGRNSRGRIRIDGKDAYPVRIASMRERPFLLKALFRGTPLELSVIEQVERAGPTLEAYWSEMELALGQGYRIALSSKRQHSKFLIGMPDVTFKTVGTAVELDIDRIPTFRRPEVHRRRQPAIYKGPLVLVRKAIPASDKKHSVFRSAKDVAFSESFYGISGFGHAQADQITRYVALILATPLMKWYSLVTSAQYGVERDALYFQDVTRLPIPRFETLTPDLVGDIEPLWDELCATSTISNRHLQWIQQLYGLAQQDWSVISDTLLVNQPKSKVQRFAQTPPTSDVVRQYMAVLRDILACALRSEIHVAAWPVSDTSAWQSVTVQRAADVQLQPPSSRALGRLFAKLADSYSASSTVLAADGALHISFLRQTRYWTRSRARLTALRILRDENLLSALEAA